MNHSVWKKRIPSLLALLLITGGIGLTSFLVQTGVIPFLRAAPSEKPVNIRITNVTDTSFTVTYKTDASVQGSCIVQSTRSTDQQVYLDERDTTTGIPTPHHIHSIRAKSLKPNTQYTFSLLSGSTTFLDNGKPFTITTGPVTATLPPLHTPLIGKTLLPSGNPPTEGLIYASVQGSQVISALIKPTGAYVLPLTDIRTENISSYISFADIKNVQLLAETQDMASQITVSLENTNPLPLITLGNDYDFTLNTQPLPTNSPSSIGFPAVFTPHTHATAKIDIPSQDQHFIDSQPLFKGQALPNATVQITIHSSTSFSDVVTADAYGNWSYRPPQLAPGAHTLTITTKNQSGILQTIQQTFTVLESGTQVAEAATPSATIAPSTPTPTTIFISTPTPIPTITTTPTAPSVPPTPSPTVTPRVISPTLQQTKPSGGKLPPTGNDSAIKTAIAGIITTVVGIGVFVVTRGASL